MRSFLGSLAALGLLTLTSCGGATTTLGEPGPSNDGGPQGQPPNGQPPSPSDAGQPPNWSDAGPLPPLPPSTCPRTGKQAPARPQPATCTPTPTYFDAGPPTSCVTDSDCTSDGGPYYTHPYCLKGTCSFDQCMEDSQCPSGTACGCAAEIGGNAIHGNLCVPATCRVNADCPSGTCTTVGPAYRCQGGPIYVCPSPADECEIDQDCCDTSKPSCAYSEPLGHRVCEAPQVCAG